jgi:hypothetical protein
VTSRSTIRTGPAQRCAGHFLRFTAAPQHRADASDKLPGGDRLGHVVVGTELEAHDLVDLTVLRGEHDHRNVRPLPQLAAYLRARQAGQHEVEQHEVGTGAIHLVQSCRTGVHDGDLEALLTEHVGKGVDNRLLVLDD